MKLARLGAVTLLVGAIWMPTTAGACSLPAPEPIEDVVSSGASDRGPLVGVHEQQHIVRFPDVLGLNTERSASVVVRYWGEEPNLRVASHGHFGIPLFGGDSCGSFAQPNGFLSAHASTERGLDSTRSAYPNLAVAAGEYGGPLSAVEEALLDERFGPPTLVTTGPDDYVAAYALVLWRPLLSLFVIGGLGWLVWRRVSLIELSDARHFSGPTAFAGWIGVTAITLGVESFGMLDYLGLILALAASIAMASMARVPWALLGPALLLWAVVNNYFFGQPRGEDDRLFAGIAILIVGSGALAWARGHWTRWPASLTVVAGTFGFTMGILEVRGYQNTTKSVALSCIATVVAAFVVWGLIFRQTRGAQGSLDQVDHVATGGAAD